jgi:hypothetical protein
MITKWNQLKQTPNWFSLEISIQSTDINALVLLFYKYLDLFFNILEKLPFIDENRFRAVNCFRIRLYRLLNCIRENTRNHLFVVR